ncbi:hypothetical protein DJ93_1168 [Bacillus clarus]|uniref:Uncharacterized protein n=1 Tax=Bacillus clarus TaxID=2338372 RepID=A0A090YZD4_9BACI|nr:hypothetical protein DJ93_1168 [Bacillus clarus]
MKKLATIALTGALGAVATTSLFNQNKHQQLTATH